MTENHPNRLPLDAPSAGNKDPAFSDRTYLYKLFWIFVFGSVIGFVVETIWCLLRFGHLAIRSSLLFGPFNLIYGFGSAALYLAFNRAQHMGTPSVFLVGMFVGSVVEYICSWVQEMVFGNLSWDYSNVPFNLNGRICLLYSIFWGVLSLLWVRQLQPAMERGIARIPMHIGKPLAVSLFVFLAVTAVLSAAAMSRWMLRLDGIPAASTMDVFLDEHFGNEYMAVVYNNILIP